MRESGVPKTLSGIETRKTGRPTRAAAPNVGQSAGHAVDPWIGHSGRPAATRSALAILCVLAVLVVGGCASTAPTAPPASASLIDSEVEAAMRLYQSGSYALAAPRLRAAADEAGRCGKPTTEANLRVGECTAWLRGSKLEEFRQCTARLEALQSELGYSEPGVNTLLALGAIARGEALPPFRLPRAVRQLLRTTAAGGA